MRGQAPGGFGTFTTIWRRTQAGEWELLAELGYGHAHHDDLTVHPPVRELSGAPGAAPSWDRGEAEAALARRMTELHRALGDGADAERLATLALPDVRVSGSPGAPGAGAAEIRAKHSRNGPRAWRVVTWGFSQALDMAFVVNRYTPAPGTDGRSGSNLEVWSADDTGWHLLMIMGEDDPPPSGG